MTQTIYLDGIEELPELYASIQEDFKSIDYMPHLHAELGHLADKHADYFSRQAGPDGVTWPKNAPRTIREKGHSRILRGKPENNHRLSRSLTGKEMSSTGDAVREAIQTDTGAYLSFGSMVPYGPTHDRDHVNPQGAFVPARRHVGIDEQYLDQATERAVDYTVGELAK